MGLKEIQELKANAGKPKEKKVYQIPKKSAKKIKQEAEEKELNSKEGKEKSLDVWFAEIEAKHWVNGYCACMETGELIPQAYARTAIAHLLPKSKFKSVATNPLNYLILSAHNGSHQKTDRIDKFVQMKVWPQAAKQINQLLPLLPHSELMCISQQLYDALENY